MYGIGILLASAVHSKAKKWIQGRKEKLPEIPLHTTPFLFHCASYGEFEQALPLIQKIETTNTNAHIVVSFFSPSGYEIVKKKYPQYTLVYLPLDTKKNAKIFLDAIHASAVFFIKYEFWHHIIYEIKQRNIPCYLVSGVFRKTQLFFKPWGAFYRNILKNYTQLFVQDELSKKLLNEIQVANVVVTGDTRFDRVTSLSKQQFEDAIIEEFIKNKKVFIAGSVWNSDNTILQTFYTNLPNDWVLIIAPHQLHEYSSDWCKNNCTYYTQYTHKNNNSVLILDTLGMLSKVYRYANLSYIGGGFGKGIHNILESICYYAPTCFGPNYKKFNEANELIARNAVFCIKDKKDIVPLINEILDKNTINTLQNTYKKYMQEKAGCTDRIIENITIV